MYTSLEQPASSASLETKTPSTSFYLRLVGTACLLRLFSHVHFVEHLGNYTLRWIPITSTQRWPSSHNPLLPAPPIFHFTMPPLLTSRSGLSSVSVIPTALFVSSVLVVVTFCMRVLIRIYSVLISSFDTSLFALVSTNLLILYLPTIFTISP